MYIIIKEYYFIRSFLVIFIAVINTPTSEKDKCCIVNVTCDLKRHFLIYLILLIKILITSGAGFTKISTNSHLYVIGFHHDGCSYNYCSILH